MTGEDRRFLDLAVAEAHAAEQAGNLPVGAVVTLDGRPVAAGGNSVYTPRHDPVRHAEVVALSRVPDDLRSRFREMTVYTTLEPCVLCTGALFLHHVRRVVYGAADPRAGGGRLFGHLPRTFQGEAERVAWEGPALPEICDPLLERVLALVAARRDRAPG